MSGGDRDREDLTLVATLIATLIFVLMCVRVSDCPCSVRRVDISRDLQRFVVCANRY